MNTPHLVYARSQRGLSLVELMISIAIGLILTLAISQLFIGTKQSYRTQDDLARMQENARFAMTLLAREIRISGFRDLNATSDFGANPQLTGANDTGPNASDSLTVRYFGSNTPAGATDGSVVDCLGNAMGRDAMTTDTFSIGTDAATGEPSLVCNGQVLLTGVESFQLLYGEDTDADGAVNRFQPAGAVNMGNVKSVLISVVMRSQSETATELDNRVYNHFGPSYAPGNAAPSGDLGSVFDPPNDRRLRRVFMTSVGVRNRLE